MTGLPRLPKPPFRRAVPTTPADRAGAHVDCFPAHAAFPKWQEGRHPHWDFRGLLGLHSCYGPLNCSTAHGGLCHEASTQMVAHPSRSSATGAIDNSPGTATGDTRIQGALHSITSSARVSSVGGKVKPRVFAVLRLRTRSNF